MSSSSRPDPSPLNPTGTRGAAVLTPPTLADLKALLLRRLTAAGLPSPEADALLLLEAALGVDRATLLLQPDRLVDGAARERLAVMLRRRLAREPLQHITGNAHFYGLELEVSEGVLVPRPETERLVELVLQELAVQEPGASSEPVGPVLDVGTGTGAVALAVKAERPAYEVWGSDVDAAAVALASANAARLGLHVTFRRSDLLADPDVARVAANCRVLVSNPPYLPDDDAPSLPPEVQADPPRALFGGEDGLDVAKALAAQAYRLLPRGALLALELDPRNAHAFARSLVGWSAIRLEADLAGRGRFVLARR